MAMTRGRAFSAAGSGATRRPIAVDLFSGAGGFSLGAEQSGFDVVAAVEYDAIHAGVHTYNFPLCEVLCVDARTLSADDLLMAIRRGVENHERGPWDGTLDAIIGGVPCQGFSAIGKRAADDPRNLLAFEFMRFVRELKPRYFAMKNVPGMTSFR